MDRPRLIRGLRIAWTVGCGILCVMLIVLWVRSYWWFDPIRLSYPNGPSLQITSWDGHISTRPTFRSNDIIERIPPSYLQNPIIVKDEFGRTADARWIYVLRYPTDGFNEVYVPHWMLALLMGGLAVAPWIHRSKRFSLRTLLIATTLVAVALGLVVWSMT
jgi:hypothetical protein